ncbi:hypothetical protein AB4144_58885, partial [Rhizobiaceae sp. 2RAB30]
RRRSAGGRYRATRDSATAYLIDENALREFGARGNANVRKWLATVDDADLRPSVATCLRSAEGQKR